MPVTISGTTGIQTPGVANSGTSSAAQFTGPLVGSVTGNVTGNLTGVASNASTAVVANSASNTVAGSNLGLAACKAWVNFNGVEVSANTVINSGGSFGGISVTSGSTDGTWAVTSAVSTYIGQVYYIRSINGVANATLGGRNVSNNGLSTFSQNVGFRIISQTTNSYGIRLLEGPALTTESVSTYTFFVTGIRSGYNISSVIRNGTADYTINFATPMTDAYYSVTSSSIVVPGTNNAWNGGLLLMAAPTTASVRVGNNSIGDFPHAFVQVFGN